MHLQAIAIVFYFVNPLIADRRLGFEQGKTRLDKTSGTHKTRLDHQIDDIK
jgi:hypothetical protein